MKSRGYGYDAATPFLCRAGRGLSDVAMMVTNYYLSVEAKIKPDKGKHNTRQANKRPDKIHGQYSGRKNPVQYLSIMNQR